MATLKFTTVPSKRLATSIDASASTIQLNNITGWNGSNLAASDFGTKLYAVLRNDANTLMEIVELDPSTIASASITILLRGLKFDGDLTTEVTANKLTWVKNETIVELGSDVPQLLNHMVRTIEDQTIAGIKTFSSLPATTAGNPINANDLARKAYVDSVVAGIATTVNVVVPGTAGETIAAGELIYFDDTENEWMKCDADTAASVENTLLGIAQGAGTNGVAITGGVLLRGLDANQTGLTAGAIYYASNTAGGISSSAGTKEVTVGFSYSTTQLYFNPRFNQQLTEDQQDALAGNNGTPSNTNKYMTQSGFQRGQEIYAADAEASDTYVVTLSPVPAGYVTGMVVRFKANTANTGACTLNVNGLGPIDVQKYAAGALGALETGDIVANQIVEVVYNGTQFQMISPSAKTSPTFAAGATSKDISDADTTQNIAHGLGAIPSFVRVDAVLANTSGLAMAEAHIVGGTTYALSQYFQGGNNGGHTTTFRLTATNGANTWNIGTITVDATNIMIAWVKTGSPTGTANIKWFAIK